MRVKTLAIIATIIPLATGYGSVCAAGEFTTLKGITAVPMSPGELAAVKGMDHHFFILVSADHPNALAMTINGQPAFVLDPPNSPNSGPLATPGRKSTDWHQDAIGANSKGANFVEITFPDGVTRLVSPAYHGLMNACGNGKIEGPGFLC